MSIEAFAVTNFVMNLLVLSVGARAAGSVRWRRVTAASFVGTVYAGAAFVYFPQLRGFAAQTCCLLLMSLILFGRRRRWLKGCLCTAVSCVFAGGVMTLLGRKLPAGSPLMTGAGAMIVAVCAFFGDGIRSGNGMNGQVLLKIATRMGSTEVEALIDTGNKLREPLSGLPIVIVGRRALKKLLDSSCLQPPSGRLPPGFRLVRYGVLGGQGEMLCFRPESVCVWSERGWREAPDVWVAIYPGDIPSGVGALAPPVF